MSFSTNQTSSERKFVEIALYKFLRQQGVHTAVKLINHITNSLCPKWISIGVKSRSLIEPSDSSSISKTTSSSASLRCTAFCLNIVYVPSSLKSKKKHSLLSGAATRAVRPGVELLMILSRKRSGRLVSSFDLTGKRRISTIPVLKYWRRRRVASWKFSSCSALNDMPRNRVPGNIMRRPEANYE